MLVTAKRALRELLPGELVTAFRARRFGLNALVKGFPGVSPTETRRLLRAIQHVSLNVECGHSEEELLRVVAGALATPPQQEGVLVECGCWKGGSTCKLSLAARALQRRLLVFDSFQGIPQNDEGFARNIHGTSVVFSAGDYEASTDEVRGNIEKYGAIEMVELIPGWFEDTLPSLCQPVACAYLDVDLVSSTLTCVQYLWPRLVPGGVIYSQDGHLVDVINALHSPSWWRETLDQDPPFVFGAGSEKLVYLSK